MKKQSGLEDILKSPIMGLLASKKTGRKIDVENHGEFVDFSTCCYLGLDHDLTNEDLKQVELHGLRNGWSRISGTSSLCRDLETEISKKMNFEETRLSPSISLINFTIFNSLASVFDFCLFDIDCHYTMKIGPI